MEKRRGRRNAFANASITNSGFSCKRVRSVGVQVTGRMNFYILPVDRSATVFYLFCL